MRFGRGLTVYESCISAGRKGYRELKFSYILQFQSEKCQKVSEFITILSMGDGHLCRIAHHVCVKKK